MDYTKGDWHINKPNLAWVRDSDNQVIANCTGYNRDEGEANAQLISACPAMYEALTDIISLIESFTPYQKTRPEIAKAKAALRKAEGKG